MAEQGKKITSQGKTQAQNKKLDLNGRLRNFREIGLNGIESSLIINY